MYWVPRMMPLIHPAKNSIFYLEVDPIPFLGLDLIDPRSSCVKLITMIPYIYCTLGGILDFGLNFCSHLDPLKDVGGCGVVALCIILSHYWYPFGTIGTRTRDLNEIRKWDCQLLFSII